MSTVKYMKNPSVKINKNWGHNRPVISSTPGEFAYLSPLIREICVQCKDLNIYLMNVLNGMDNGYLEKTTLAKLNAYHPDILRRAIYDQTIYNKIITALPSLCEHYNRNGKCDVEGCIFNTSGSE